MKVENLLCELHDVFSYKKIIIILEKMECNLLKKLKKHIVKLTNHNTTLTKN